MRQRQPHALAASVDFETRPHPRVGVFDGFEGLPVPGSAHWRRIGRDGIFLAGEQIGAHLLGVQRGAIDQHAGSGVGPAFREHDEVLFGAVELAGKAEQFKQEGAAAHVGGVLAHLRANGLNGLRSIYQPYRVPLRSLQAPRGVSRPLICPKRKF